jgi:hypothetical protein
VESSASIHKQPGSRCEELNIHPSIHPSTTDQEVAAKRKATISASGQVAAAKKRKTTEAVAEGELKHRGGLICLILINSYTVLQ